MPWSSHRSEEQEPASPALVPQRFAAGPSSPKIGGRGGQRGRPNSGMAPLALPGESDLFVDTGPPTDSQSFGLGSPTSARQIRDRPIDVDKEIPLLFVDDTEGVPPTPGADGASSSNAAAFGGALPASRQNSAGLASALLSSQSPYALAQLSSSVLPQDIRIPQCVANPNWEAPPVARRFRLPNKLLTYRPQAGHERVAEYELDSADLAWLARLNDGLLRSQIVLDEERMEEAMDTLEKSSFRALHGAAHAHRTLYAPPVPTPLLHASGGYHGGSSPHRASSHALSSSSGHGHHGGGHGEGTGRRKEAKRASSSMPSPQRSPKHHKQSKPDRPPPPSDTELIHLPAGLCRRYQQGRCHKGRSCKWKHEVWPELQLRWEQWQSGNAAAAAPASGGTERTSAAAAAQAAAAAAAAAASEAHARAQAAAHAASSFPPPTVAVGTAQQQFKSFHLLPPKDDDDPLGEMALSELGLASALELVPPSLVPPGMVEREAAARSHHAATRELSLMGGGGAGLPPPVILGSMMGITINGNGPLAGGSGGALAGLHPGGLVTDEDADAEADAMLEEIVGPGGAGSPGIDALAPSLAAGAAGGGVGIDAATNAAASAYSEMLNLVDGGVAAELATDAAFPALGGAEPPAVRVSLAGVDSSSIDSEALSADGHRKSTRTRNSHAPSAYGNGLTDPSGAGLLTAGEEEYAHIDDEADLSSVLLPPSTSIDHSKTLVDSPSPADAAEGNDSSSDFGIPRASLRDLLRGLPTKIQNALYDWWLEKRRKDVRAKPRHHPLHRQVPLHPCTPAPLHPSTPAPLHPCTAKHVPPAASPRADLASSAAAPARSPPLPRRHGH